MMRRIFLLFLSAIIIFLTSCSLNIGETSVPTINVNPTEAEEEVFDAEKVLKRKFTDETYEVDFLFRVYGDEDLLLLEREFKKWYEDEYLPELSLSEPLIYSTLKNFGIDRSKFESVNSFRKSRGYSGALDNEEIDRIFADDYLTNTKYLSPYLLEYGGKYYTYDEVMKLDEPYKTVPYDVLNPYLDKIAATFAANGLDDPVSSYDFTRWDISAYLDNIVFNTDREIARLIFDKDEFYDKFPEMMGYDLVPDEYILEITGLSSKLEFEMTDKIHPGSVRIYSQTVRLADEISVWGDGEVNWFGVGDAVIFTWDYYKKGYSVFVCPRFHLTIGPDEKSSYLLVPGENGGLDFIETTNLLPEIEKNGVLSVATSYTDFYKSRGAVEVEDYQITFLYPSVIQNISTAFDLEKEFEEKYAGTYSSIEELFAENRQKASENP